MDPEMLQKQVYGLVVRLHDFLSNSKLAGLMPLSDQEYEMLATYSRQLIHNEVEDYQGLIFKKDKIRRGSIISLFLFHWGIKEYKNQFWNELSEKVGLDLLTVQKFCKESIKYYCIEFDTFFYSKHNRNAYVTTVLTHSVLPESHMSSFLDLMVDLYIHDLEEDLDEVILHELISCMHDLFSFYDEEEDIQIEFNGSKMTYARQQLPKSFRLALINYQEIIEPLLERLFSYIHSSRIGREIEWPDKEDRFDKSFRAYLKEKVLELSPVAGERSSSKARRWNYRTAAYQLDQNNGRLSLYIPGQVIRPAFFKIPIMLTLYDEAGLIAEMEMTVLKNRKLMFTTEEKTVSLTGFRKGLKYRITNSSGVLFDSGDRLFRDYLFFDDQGEEISPDNLSTSTHWAVTENGDSIVAQNADIRSASCNGYTLWSLSLNNNSSLIAGNCLVSVDQQKITGGISKFGLVPGVWIEQNPESSYSVYNESPIIRLRMSETLDLSRYFIFINGNDLNKELELYGDVTKMLLEDGSNDTVYEIKIKDQVLLENNPAELKVRMKGSEKILYEKNLFFLPHFSYSFDKNVYFQEKKAFLEELDCKELTFLSRQELPVSLPLKMFGSFKSYFSFRDNKYRLKIEIPHINWSIASRETIFTDGSENIVCVKDIINKLDMNLVVKTPFPDLTLYVEKEDQEKQVSGRYIDGRTFYRLNELINVSDTGSVPIKVSISGEKIPIVTLIPDDKIVDLDVRYSDEGKALTASWQYYGTKELHARLTDSENRILKEWKPEKSFLLEQNYDLEYGKYTFTLYYEEDAFMGSGSDEFILGTSDFESGDKFLYAIKGKTLVGKTCYRLNLSFPVENFYLRNIKETSIVGQYSCSAFLKIFNRETHKNNIRYFEKNPFYISVIEQTFKDIQLKIYDCEKEPVKIDTISRHINPRLGYRNIDTRKVDSMFLEIQEEYQL